MQIAFEWNSHSCERNEFTLNVQVKQVFLVFSPIRFSFSEILIGNKWKEMKKNLKIDPKI